MSPQSTYSKDVRLLGSNKVFPIYLCGCSLLDINQLFSPLNQTRSSPFLSTVCLDSFASPGEKSVCHLRIASLDGNLDTQIPLWKLKKKKTNLRSVAPTFRTKQNINAIPWWDIQKSIFPKMRCLKEVTCIQLVIFFKEQTPIIRSEKRKEKKPFCLYSAQNFIFKCSSVEPIAHSKCKLCITWSISCTHKVVFCHKTAGF